MKLCFFTDIHGNKPAFEAFCSEIESKNPDQIIFGGDFIGYYYNAQEIISTIREKGWHCLLGNHDKMFLDMLDGQLDEQYVTKRYGNSYLIAKETISKSNIDFLRALSSSFEIQTNNMRIGFFHGGPKDFLNERLYPDTDLSYMEENCSYDYIFAGHTHHKMIRKVGNCTVINHGSAGQQRDGKGTSYVLFDTVTGEIELCSFTYDMTELIEQIKQYDGNNETMYHKLTEVLTRTPLTYKNN